MKKETLARVLLDMHRGEGYTKRVYTWLPCLYQPINLSTYPVIYDLSSVGIYYYLHVNISRSHVQRPCKELPVGR